jgi:hypothetical protein
MEQTKIKISVSRKSAIAAGRTSYGDQVVTLSDADVAALTPEEREELLRLGTGYERDGEKGVLLTETITDSDGRTAHRGGADDHGAEDGDPVPLLLLGVAPPGDLRIARPRGSPKELGAPREQTDPKRRQYG